ncbi:MAG: hypothetical protein GX055_09940 [Desulfovibrionales bacterium]|nr:hypothetical protein [Desulfovibrionales bacterium]
MIYSEKCVFSFCSLFSCKKNAAPKKISKKNTAIPNCSNLMRTTDNITISWLNTLA